MSNYLGNIGVHATHCCVLHGCKYGDEDCPVVAKQVTQEYPCENCPEGARPNILTKIEITQFIWKELFENKMNFYIFNSNFVNLIEGQIVEFSYDTQIMRVMVGNIYNGLEGLATDHCIACFK